jgi:hypothetical protein
MLQERTRRRQACGSLRRKRSLLLAFEDGFPVFAQAKVEDRGRRDETGAAFIAQAAGGLQFDLYLRITGMAFG